MAGIRLEWAQFGDFDSFDVIRSDTPMDINALPSPIATNLPTMYHVDTTVVEGATYYYRVVAWRDGVSKVSGEIELKASSGDEHWNNVVALLHFDGDLTDETGRVWTGDGSFSYVSGQFGFGFTSGGGWVSTPASPDLNLSTGDFTIECFMGLTGTSGLRALLSSGVRDWAAGNIYILVDGSNRLEIGSYEDGHIWISSATLPSSGVFHFCLERLAGEFRLFVDGGLVDSILSSAPLNFSTNGTKIGVNSGEGNRFSGVIDELRITKDVARYTEDFTPPVKPFPRT